MPINPYEPKNKIGIQEAGTRKKGIGSLKKATTSSSLREHLERLVPLQGLPREYLTRLIRQSDTLVIPAGGRIETTAKSSDHLLFLIQGELLLDDGYTSREKVTRDGSRARFPLNPENGTETVVTCLTDTRLLRLPRNILQRLKQMAAESDVGPDEIAETGGSGDIEKQIYLDFIEALRNGRVKLPAMPEVAVRVAKQIDADEADNETIARMIQMDPAITARLIQVANSPAMGSIARIETCRDAVTRLGHKATRNLVTGFVLKGLFRSPVASIKNRMSELWQHSTLVAATCFVLAKEQAKLDPWKALLAGLVHDIGVIPILTEAQRYPELVDDPQALEQLVHKLRAEFSVLTLSKWGFLSDFAEISRDAENWLRESKGEADYTDLLVIAQMHAFFGTEGERKLPKIEEVPAARKLGLDQADPQASLELMRQARHEIAEVRRMIR